ncbi:MAG: SulP family inorganic anion transporter, partial [Caldilineaceae bacterium]
SRHLAVQATSATAALIASSVGAALVATASANASDPETYQAYASAFVLVTGLVFLVAGLARLGFITQFLSKPVMDGFVSGLAIFVVVGQLNKLFGVPKPDGNTVARFLGIVKELPQANWVAFAVGAATLALLFLLPLWNKKIPAGLVVLFGTIILSAVLDLEGRFGVDVVGTLPQGLPAFALPQVPFTTYLAMVLPAIGALLVAYSEALGVAREFAEKHGYEVDPNQELNAHAIANLVSAVFGGMIAAGSMSASAVKESAGAKTQVTNLVSWVLVIATVLFLTPLFASLPESVLAALIIHAVWHIIASRKLQRVRLVSRTEFVLGLLALFGVLLIDVLQGLVIGLVASLVLVIYRSSRPHISSLGHVPGEPGAYSALDRHPENISVPGVLILRLDSPMTYYNALTVRDRLNALVAASQPPPRAVILDAPVQDQLDITSGEVLKGFLKDMHAAGIGVYVTDVHTPVVEFAQRIGLAEMSEPGHRFATVDAAVRALAG